MCTKRELILFFAGAEAFHTLSHILISFTTILPLRVYGMVFTPQFNFWMIIINAAITAGLLYWACKTKNYRY